MSNLCEEYLPLYISKKRYFLITGGRGSLKSSHVHDFVLRLTYEKGHGILFTRYTMVSAERSIIPEFNALLEKIGAQDDFEVTKRSIKNKHTGSFIWFSGIKTATIAEKANLKSMPGITTWVIEEGEDFEDEEEFDTIDDSIRENSKDLRVIWIQNPRTRNHFIYNRWIKPFPKTINKKGYPVTISGHPDVEHIHTTYHLGENLGYLAGSWLKKAHEWQRKDLEATGGEKKPEGHYYHNYIGGWMEIAKGAIIKNWELKEFPEDLTYIWGSDFGFVNDPTTLVKFAKKKNNIYVKGYLHRLGMDTKEISGAYEVHTHKGEIIVADRAESRLIDELGGLGHNMVNAHKPPGSVKNGLTKLTEEGVTIFVDPSCPKLITEFQNYAWLIKSGSEAKIVDNNVPIDKWNHFIDPIRYCNDYLDLVGNIKVY